MTNLFAYFTSGRGFIYFAGASFLAAALFELGAVLIFFAVQGLAGDEIDGADNSWAGVAAALASGCF